MRFRDGRQVLETFEAMRLETPLILVELASGHAPLPTCLADVAELLGKIQDTQSLLGDFPEYCPKTKLVDQIR